jgi:hypothetical protein
MMSPFEWLYLLLYVVAIVLQIIAMRDTKHK